MRMLVLGAGRQGTACAFDLLRTTQDQVTLADSAAPRLSPLLQQFEGDRLRCIELDVRDAGAVSQAFVGHDAVMSAVPYYFNLELARLAVDAGLHFADLGGNTEIVRQQRALHEQAVSQGVTILADCGLAPGMVNILAADGIGRLDSTDTVRIFVGGLPQHPKPPLNYEIVYSLEGALDYYTTQSWVLRNGRPTQVAPLTDIEPVDFPPPLGRLEAFHTAGGISTMPWDFEGRVDTMEYKTLRYPGHADLMSAFSELGLLALEPVDIKGTLVRPRDVFIAAVDSKLRNPDGLDLVAVKVVVRGTKAGKPALVRYGLLDYHDTELGISAMMRTTGYSLSITGQMQAAGQAGPPGFHTAYEAVPVEPYLKELRRRGINVEVTE